MMAYSPPVPELSRTAQATLDQLWERIRVRGDLPGFSRVVDAVLGAMRGEDQDTFNMTRTVLSDPSLTQKVLRLANSPMYAMFGREIGTVSRAVMVLGTDAIGHLALGLKLIDGLSAVSASSSAARDEMEKAVLAGHVARQVAGNASARDSEEAAVCSMLHGLGRMMLSFYLSERWESVLRAAGNGQEEAVAVQAEFGLPLDEVGRAVSQRWGFPGTLVASLADVRPREVSEPLSHGEWLAALSTMSSECAGVMHQSGDGDMRELTTLAAGYAGMLGMEVTEILGAVEAARKAVEEESGIASPPLAPVAPARDGKPDDALERLRRGVAEMREAADSLDASQMMTMALETVYRGLGFSRTAAFIRHRDRGQYQAHLVLGEGMPDLIPQLAFPDAYQPDVFHAALANDKMIFIENARASAFASKLPRWWREALPTARSFVLLPLVSNRQPIGFLYGDWDDTAAHGKIDATEIALLDALRKLVVTSMSRR